MQKLEIDDVVPQLQNIAANGLMGRTFKDGDFDMINEAISLIKQQQSELEAAKAEIERLRNLINQSNQELIENCTCTFRDDVVAGVVRRCALCPIQYSIKPEDK